MAVPVGRYTEETPPRARPVVRQPLALGSLITIGLWTGLFAALIIILWSKSSAVMAGLLAGVICGFVAGGKARAETPAEGAVAAGIAGLIAGAVLLVGQVIRYYGFEVTGYVRNNLMTSFSGALSAALLGVALTVGLAALFGFARYLRPARSRLMTVGMLALLILVFPFVDQKLGLLVDQHADPDPGVYAAGAGPQHRGRLCRPARPGLRGVFCDRRLHHGAACRPATSAISSATPTR